VPVPPWGIKRWKGRRRASPPPPSPPSCRRDSRALVPLPTPTVAFTVFTGPVGHRQLCRGSSYPGGRSNPVHGAHVFFFGRTGALFLFSPRLCSALLVFSNARGGRGIGTGRSGRGVTGRDAFCSER